MGEGGEEGGKKGRASCERDSEGWSEDSAEAARGLELGEGCTRTFGQRRRRRRSAPSTRAPRPKAQPQRRRALQSSSAKSESRRPHRRRREHEDRGKRASQGAGRRAPHRGDTSAAGLGVARCGALGRPLSERCERRRRQGEGAGGGAGGGGAGAAAHLHSVRAKR